MRCEEYSRLQGDVQEILEALTRLTATQLLAFQSKNHREFTRLDKELEQTVGVKERRIGALRQHVQEHGCQQLP